MYVIGIPKKRKEKIWQEEGGEDNKEEEGEIVAEIIKVTINL